MTHLRKVWSSKWINLIHFKRLKLCCPDTRLISSSSSSSSSSFSVFSQPSLLTRSLCQTRCQQSESDRLHTIDFEDQIRQRMRHFTESAYVQLSIDDFQSLITSPQDEFKINFILELYEQSKQQTEIRMPKRLDCFHMENLMHVFDHKFKIIKYLAYCGQVERLRYRSKVVKELMKDPKSKAENEMKQLPDGQDGPRSGIMFDSEGAPVYGLWKNSMFIRSANRSRQLDNRRNLLHSALFGQKLILDFAYQELMPPTDYTGVAMQVLNIFKYNRQDSQPFNLWLCNLPIGSRFRNRIHQIGPNLFHPTSFCNITGQSFLDIGIPHHKLVYLSPDADQTLTTFDQDQVYILGGFVDRNDNRPESLKRADQAGVKAMKLPIADHVIWKDGTNQNLPMYSVFRMLLHMNKSYACWKHAILEFAPQSKQMDELETLAVHQPKMFDQLLKQDYAYVRSRKYVRDRLLCERIKNSRLLDCDEQEKPEMC